MLAAAANALKRTRDPATQMAGVLVEGVAEELRRGELDEGGWCQIILCMARKSGFARGRERS